MHRFREGDIVNYKGKLCKIKGYNWTITGNVWVTKLRNKKHISVAESNLTKASVSHYISCFK